MNKIIAILSHEVSATAALLTIFAALGGSMTWAQMQSWHNCEIKGPAKCSMAAIKPW